MLKVLFVCSGPAMYASDHYPMYEGLDEMRRELPSDIYDYVVRNKLIMYYADDEELEYPYFMRRDLPTDYIKRMLRLEGEEVDHRDLDIYREYIISILKQLYPTLNHIDYETVDPITLDPKVYGDDEIMQIIREQDQKYKDSYGVEMKFLDHHPMTFQDYLNSGITNKYDIVWFLQCTDFSLVVDISDMYLRNFKQLLKQDGLIIHTDWGGKKKMDPKTERNQPVMEIIPIDDRYNLLPAQARRDKYKVEWFLEHVDQIETGVYKFKGDSRKKLLSLLLL